MIKKKVISILLAVVLVCAIIPMTAFAADETNAVDVESFEQLKENIGKEGVVINLTSDITLTEKLTVSNTVTINGNGYTIHGQNNNYNVYIEVTNGTFTMNNVKLSEFGGEIESQSSYGVIKVPDTASADVKVIATDVSVTDYNRAAFDIRSGSVEISNSEINCLNTYAEAEGTKLLTKGILLGGGSNKVTGNITGVTVTNPKSTFDDWATSAIEVYSNTDIAIRDCKVSNTTDGIMIDNYWFDTMGDVNVTISNTTVDAGNRAVAIYSKADTSANATANIESGNYTGKISFTNKTDKDTINVYGGTFNGAVSEDVTLAENIVLEEQADGSYVARVDNSELKALVEKYEALVKEDYTSETWKNFEENFSNSKDLLNNVNATKTQLDEAVAALTNAYNGLERAAQISVDAELTVSVDESANEVLSSNEKVQGYIAQGIDVGTVITVEDKTPTAEEAAMVEEAAGNGVVAKYFNIEVLIKNMNTGAEIDKITELSKEVKFTVALDDELKNVPDGYERTYKVLRIHDGKVDVLDAVLSEDKNSIEFSTDKFSTYAISYVDTKITETPNEGEEIVNEPANEVTNETVTDGDANKDIVQTGDYIYVAVGLIVVLAIANAVYFIRRKRK